MENTLTVAGSLTELNSKLRVKFPSLTDADFYYEEDEKDEMLKKIRIKVGKTKEEWDEIMAAL